MPAALSRRWTLAEVRALTDATPDPAPRFELVDGELLVTPSPVMRHQRAVRTLLVAFDAYLDKTAAGEAFDSPFDVELERNTIVRPDVFAVHPTRPGDSRPRCRPDRSSS